MYPPEPGRPVIDVILPMAQIEMQNAHRDHFDDFAVGMPGAQMLGHGSCRRIQNSMHVVELKVVLNLDDDKLALVVPGFQIEPILLVGSGSAVAKLTKRRTFATDDLQPRNHDRSMIHFPISGHK